MILDYIIFLIFPILFYFMVIKPKNDESKKRSALQVNDFVSTSFGLLGTIKQIKNDFVILSIAKNVEVKVLLSSIAEKIDTNSKKEQSHD